MKARLNTNIDWNIRLHLSFVFSCSYSAATLEFSSLMSKFCYLVFLRTLIPEYAANENTTKIKIADDA